MNGRALAALAALTLTVGFVPAAAFADTHGMRSYILDTKQTDAVSAGEYDGRLRINIAPDGIVNGSFMNTEGGISSVVGGLDGTKIWLDLGHASPTPKHWFNGTFVDGKLEMSATEGRHAWTFEGTPAKV
jgi:hypothetical protein